MAPNTQTYRERVPVREGRRLLSCGWIQHVSSAGPVYEHRTVPNGSVEISCALSTGVIRVTGPRRTPAVAFLARGETVVGLRLRPGVAASLLGPPASELVDLAVDADGLWGRSARALGQRLAEAASAEEVLAGLADAGADDQADGRDDDEITDEDDPVERRDVHRTPRMDSCPAPAFQSAVTVPAVVVPR